MKILEKEMRLQKIKKIKDNLNEKKFLAGQTIKHI